MSSDSNTAQSTPVADATPAEVSQHFVTFYSPGTFVAEMSSEPIASWDVEAACEIAHGIKERHGATPYGFRFTTRSRGPADLDSRETAKSGVYFLGGIVETLEQVKARADPADRILILNMEGNGHERIVTNSNSWKWTQPLNAADVVLDWTPRADGPKGQDETPAQPLGSDQ